MVLNIFDDISNETILRRIQDLDINSEAHFGKMNVNQMLCHCADQLRLAMSFIVIPLEGNKVSRFFKKTIALNINSIPQEKIETLDEINQNRGGTKPVGFENDRVNLVKLLEYLRTEKKEYKLQPHPMFGELTEKEWGKLIYIHIDHHLKQFGV